MVQWYDFQAKNQSQSDMEEISGLFQLTNYFDISEKCSINQQMLFLLNSKFCIEFFEFLNFGFRELVGPDVHDLQNLGKGFFMKAFCHGRSQIYQVPGNDRVIL